jgi:hypothetical protein
VLEDDIEELVRRGGEREGKVRATLIELGLERALLVEQRGGDPMAEEIQHLEARMVDLERRIAELQQDARRDVEHRQTKLSQKEIFVRALEVRVDALHDQLAEHALRREGAAPTSALSEQVVEARDRLRRALGSARGREP